MEYSKIACTPSIPKGKKKMHESGGAPTTLIAKYNIVFGQSNLRIKGGSNTVINIGTG